MQNIKRLAASCFGLGWLPFAPGTWGSLPTTIVFIVMCCFQTPTPLILAVMTALAVIGIIVCIRFTPFVIAATGDEDPSEVVADEFAGQAITFLFVPFLGMDLLLARHYLATAAAGFFLFRAFDTLKPWPSNKLEKLPKGWGVLADDLMAGVYAGVALIICARLGWLEYLSGLIRFDGRLNIFSAIILGTVQGLTEFLPVSSDGHLVLMETFLKFDAATPQMLLFDLSAHLGTLIVIIVVFRKSIASIISNLKLEISSSAGRFATSPVAMFKEKPGVHLLVLMVIATVVTGVVGILFKKYFISARGSMAVLVLMWFINGTLLLITDWRKRTLLELQQIGLLAAVLVGLAQAAAMLPAISRSGTTICTAILIGLKRNRAVEFSFLIAIPAILGAAVIELVANFGQILSGSLPISSVLTGSIVAAVVGALALKLLIKAAGGTNLKFFGFYCYILACFVLVYILR